MHTLFPLPPPPHTSHLLNLSFNAQNANPLIIKEVLYNDDDKRLLIQSIAWLRIVKMGKPKTNSCRQKLNDKMIKKTTLIACITVASMYTVSAQITDPAPYCDAKFDDDPFQVDDFIRGVTFGTLVNASNAQYAAPHYVFYNNLAIPEFTKGSTATLAVVFDVKGGAGYGVWIDWNQNNVFEASERVSGTPVTESLDITAYTTVTEIVTIPADAMTGETRMRVRIVEDDNYTMGASGYAIAPCNASASAEDIMDWGETEDYTIKIVGTSSVNEIAPITNLNLYPNPVTSVLNIGLEIPNNLTYKIINITGQEIQTGIVRNGERQIDVAALAEGVYMIQFADQNKPFGQQKFVKTAK